MSDFIVTTAIKKLSKLNKRNRVVQGGTSAGKTFGILPLLIDHAIRNPNKEPKKPQRGTPIGNLNKES